MRIAIASDHAAYELKAVLADWLRGEGYEVADLGPDSPDSVDYPDYGYAARPAASRCAGRESGSPFRSIATRPAAAHASTSRFRHRSPASTTMPMSSRLARA